MSELKQVIRKEFESVTSCHEIMIDHQLTDQQRDMMENKVQTSNESCTGWPISFARPVRTINLQTSAPIGAWNRNLPPF